jgi:hypothetical protein
VSLKEKKGEKEKGGLEQKKGGGTAKEKGEKEEDAIGVRQEAGWHLWGD